MKKYSLIMLSVFICAVFTAHAQKEKLPNIVVVLVDDMGFSDFGSYGSEIKTPNLDLLAQNGIRLNNFYNTARCCPTRASLLTGLYAHQAGMGYMTGKLNDNPAYQGYINTTSVTLGEAMKQAGYFTFMTGKWHVGQKGDGGVTPWNRGFDRSLNAPAGGFYFHDDKAKLYLNGKDITDIPGILPNNWYSTDLWTTFGLKFAKEAQKEKKPFVWYLAHNAPHFPLQAPEEDIAKFRGKYMKGWELIREERYNTQVRMGLIDKNYKLPPINPIIPKWNSLTAEEKRKQDDLMAVYAAMISRIDKSVGDLVKALKEMGEYENTIIMVMSDNGGNAEGGIQGRFGGEGSPGAINSNLFLSQGWAEVNNTPFWLYKHNTSEGGIASPFIMSWPKGISEDVKGKIFSTPAHVIDILPTCLAIANGSYPKTYNGNNITPVAGVSILPLLQGKPVIREEPLYWEHEGNRAMRSGNWKVVSNLNEEWQLYNLATDRTEVKNLAKDQPERLNDMINIYETWYKKIGAQPYFTEPKKWQIRMGANPTIEVENKKQKKSKS